MKKRIRHWLWTLRPTNVFPPYTDYYDDESRALVAERFRRDIELFGYGCGAEVPTTPPAPRLTAR